MELLVAEMEPGHGSPGQRFWPGRVMGQCVRPGV